MSNFLVIEPFGEIQNQSQQPVIEVVKTINVVIPIGATASTKKVQFPADTDIDNSIVKGIRWEPYVFNSMVPIKGTISNSDTAYGYAMTIEAQVIYINLCDKLGKIKVKNLPLTAIGGYRSQAGIANSTPVVTPRFNTQLTLKKCYLNFIPGLSGNVKPIILSLTFTFCPVPPTQKWR